MAEAFGQRPSAILGITDPWIAYQLDLAVLILGRRAQRATAEPLAPAPASPPTSFASVRHLARPAS